LLTFIGVLALQTQGFATVSSFSQQHLYMTLQRGTPKQETLKLHLALTAVERAQGYMHVKDLPSQEGMLFVFDKADKQCFWMKDTLVPLDLVFLDENNRVVKMHPNMTPLSEIRYCSDQPVRKAIEMKAGRLQELGLKVGMALWMDTQPPAPVTIPDPLPAVAHPPKATPGTPAKALKKTVARMKAVSKHRATDLRPSSPPGA
jgi:uncharacterized membrane protein (UPF0127 family)